MGDVDGARRRSGRAGSALGPAYRRVRRSRPVEAAVACAVWFGGWLRGLWNGGARRWWREFDQFRYEAWESFKAGPVGRALAAAYRWCGRSLHWLRTHRGPRRIGLAVALFAVAVFASMLGATLAGKATVPIGPFQSSMAIQPSVTGETRVGLPPLGSLTLDSHTGPMKLDVSLDSLDQARTQALVADPDGLAKASEGVAEDVVSGLVTVALRALAGAALAGVLLGAVLFRSVRRAAISGGLSVLLTASVIGLGALTLRPQSIEEPRYDGLLANAPAVVGDARQIADKYEAYRAQLQKMVTNAAKLYTTASTLPNEPDPNTIRILHVSDLHLNPAAWSVISTVVQQFRIDAVVDTGDITDWGTEQEAKAFTAAIGTLPVPYIYIRGNHDSAATAEAVASHSNAIVLDNDTTTVAGLTFAGIGDPRFTPDKSSEPSDLREEQVMYNSGAKLAKTVEDSEQPVNVCLVHDPISATPLAGEVPLVLAGHKHARETSVIPGSPTRLMVEGSTGGAGLRGLEGAQPTPLELSVLYFNRDDKGLSAYDDITLGGAGQTEVSLQRHVIGPEQAAPEQSPSGS